MAEHSLDTHDFFLAALRILEEADPSAVTVNALCGRLDVTKGSYFHHFQSREEFIAGLSTWWESRFNRLFAAYNSEPDRYAQVELIVNCTARLPHRAEAALRSWSYGEPAIEAAQRRVAAAGEAALANSLRRFVDDDATAVAAARHGVALAVGLQHHWRDLDRAGYLAAITDWIAPCLKLNADTFMTASGPTFWIERDGAPRTTAPPESRGSARPEMKPLAALVYRRRA